MKYYVFVLMFLLPALDASAGPLSFLKREIRKNGYILYTTPLSSSGIGTMVGGSPNGMIIGEEAQRCFPDTVNGQPTELRKYSEITLGSFSQTTSFKGSAVVDLLKFMNNANSVLKIKAGVDTVQSVELQFEGATVEYISTINLQKFYLEQMDEECKTLLNDLGFVSQALKVDKMRYAFKNSTGAYLQLSADAISEYFDIDLDLQYHIEQEYILVIDTPKYIGYQLGRLKPKDKGWALYRSQDTFLNHYIFRSMSLFPQQ